VTRYTRSKHIKVSGYVIEGRGWSKAVANARFKKALTAYRKRPLFGLIKVANDNNIGGLPDTLIRKPLVAWHYAGRS